MKAIIQRVSKASVTVGEEQVSAIGRGLCVLLGISVEDTQKDIDYMVRKILNMRLFEDENGRAWSRSVMDRELEVLCVSQFTLQCLLKGNKPDFHAAMPAELAQPFYASMLEHMRSTYRPELIKDGQFGAYMQVHIQNDGPVTIELESPTGPMDPKQSEEMLLLGLNELPRIPGRSDISRDPDALLGPHLSRDLRALSAQHRRHATSGVHCLAALCGRTGERSGLPPNHVEQWQRGTSQSKFLVLGHHFYNHCPMASCI
ncbi:D-aminoacyl-tRNA deacylase 1 isoform X1 [Megalops cyprinoides]|uniref:D-aminoacyl-tRNA deacylase 1 isoform X1 n=1 Tax=Megalops cyprinoides TaxID=118141 RepID=UPI001864B7FC|nr:D-aminoacyl-tRNA deacylase 1 isoform X1 [Megalops cyprinoides]